MTDTPTPAELIEKIRTTLTIGYDYANGEQPEDLLQEEVHTFVAERMKDALLDLMALQAALLAHAQVMPDDTVKYGDTVRIDYVDADHVQVTRVKGS